MATMFVPRDSRRQYSQLEAVAANLDAGRLGLEGFQRVPGGYILESPRRPQGNWDSGPSRVVAEAEPDKQRSAAGAIWPDLA
jgi:hypothetical protein